jgi:hypothetical protein
MTAGWRQQLAASLRPSVLGLMVFTLLIALQACLGTSGLGGRIRNDLDPCAGVAAVRLDHP